MGYQEDSIDWSEVVMFDRFLDRYVGQKYIDQPLAQDWARISKVTEESGEAISKFILMTGQNPRKGQRGMMNDVLEELADTAFTAIYAIQHFTKSDPITRSILRGHQDKARRYRQETIARMNHHA